MVRCEQFSLFHLFPAYIKYVLDGNLLDDNSHGRLWFLGKKPAIYFIAWIDLIHHIALTMSFVRRVASASVAAPSPAYLMSDFK